jgi:hypothetical protein
VLNPSRRVQARRVASKSASQRALLRPPERHCTCRVARVINPSDDPVTAWDSTRMRSAGSSMLRTHHAASEELSFVKPCNHVLACGG